jgi:hypothetical protein
MMGAGIGAAGLGGIQAMRAAGGMALDGADRVGAVRQIIQGLERIAQTKGQDAARRELLLLRQQDPSLVEDVIKAIQGQ